MTNKQELILIIDALKTLRHEQSRYFPLTDAGRDVSQRIATMQHCLEIAAQKLVNEGA